MLPGATDGDGREKQLSDGVGGRLQCGDHLPIITLTGLLDSIVLLSSNINQIVNCL